MKFEQVCQTFNQYLSQQNYWRVLLPLAVPGMFVCAGLQLISNFIYLGAVVNVLSYVGFWLFLLLSLSTCSFRMSAIGLGIMGLDHVWNLLSSLFKYHSLNYSALLYLALYGGLAYLAYRKSLSVN